MKRGLWAAAAAAFLIFATNSLAAEPVDLLLTVRNYSNPTSTTARMNIDVSFFDSLGNLIHEPATPVKLYVTSNCGNSAATATLTTHNGMTVVMKKSNTLPLNYDFVIPMVKYHWSIEFNQKILNTNNNLGGCLEIGAYGNDGSSILGVWGP